ncbi:hypothetical protein VHEMI06565 [[Torrubiella] hemipterigena]|nr:hypothetical protein VHEMI06565 [[Torrubiella] hemipterigena]
MVHSGLQSGLRATFYGQLRVTKPLANIAYRTAPCARAFHSSSGYYREISNQNQVKAAGRPGSSASTKDFAFAFDIDGVLYKGHEKISGARETLLKIHNQGLRYVFLTNGGGTNEDAKAASLAKRLQLTGHEDVLRDRVILSHTPMRGWDTSIKKDQTVLITGSHPETSRQVAMEYGFERAITPADLIHANHAVYPFAHLKNSLHAPHRPLPDGKRAAPVTDAYSREIASDALKIDKILVWNDPRDWSLDIQVIYDLLVSHQGYLGTLSSKNGNSALPNNGWQQDGQPDLWISNLDLFWKTEYPINRFGTGAFLDALKGVWSAATDGAQLQYNALGKPNKNTYEYAHDRLTYFDASSVQGGKQPLKRVYMIGDNPESDIRGANEFSPADGTEWISILVRTGVWQPTDGEPEPRYKPRVIVNDVVDAIVWAMRNEGADVSREWLLSGPK